MVGVWSTTVWREVSISPNASLMDHKSYFHFHTNVLTDWLCSHAKHSTLLLLKGYLSTQASIKEKKKATLPPRGQCMQLHYGHLKKGSGEKPNNYSIKSNKEWENTPWKKERNKERKKKQRKNEETQRKWHKQLVLKCKYSTDTSQINWSSVLF